VARIVLDTDVASLGYKGRLPMPLAARLAGHEICVTFVTVGELARRAGKRRWGTRARSELARWLGHTIVMPYDERVAWKWGQLSVHRDLNTLSWLNLIRCVVGDAHLKVYDAVS
jgi:predicted nucleic acid-binding protein